MGTMGNTQGVKDSNNPNKYASKTISHRPASPRNWAKPVSPNCNACHTPPVPEPLDCVEPEVAVAPEAVAAAGSVAAPDEASLSVASASWGAAASTCTGSVSGAGTSSTAHCPCTSKPSATGCKVTVWV